MKTCTTCRESKPLAKFSKRSKSCGTYRNKCKDCHNTYVREKWYPANASKHKEAVAKYKAANPCKVIATALKVDESLVARLLSTTDCCAICGITSDLCVDHCHDTGTVRGRLCRRCNIAIGILGDSKEAVIPKLDRILKYFEQ